MGRLVSPSSGTPTRSFVSSVDAHFGISYDGPDEGYRA